MNRELQSTIGARLTGFAAALAIGLLGLVGTAAASEDAGDLQFMRNATSEFDRFLTGSTADQQAWMRSHYSRARGYPPFYDRALGWAPPSEAYLDLYAIYSAKRGDGMPDRTTFEEHPDWVLRDSAGRPLFIPYACSGGTCPQYAGDFGNPEFQAYWIEMARDIVGRGYDGIHIDDVNLEMRVGNGNGDEVRPIDPRSGQPMSADAWNGYMAAFMERIRASLPGVRISENPIWWVPHSDAAARRAIDAADVIELERGFNDAGITGGGGTYGFETFLDHIDWLHDRGKSVVYEPYDLDPASREYALAGYFLMNDGEDMITSSHEADPNDFWSGWETDLGTAKGERYEWNGMLRRDFARGSVLLNGPDEPTRRATLDGSYTHLDGSAAEKVALGAASGIVLVGERDSVAATATVVDPVEGTGAAIRGFVRNGKRGKVKLRVKRRVGGGWKSAGSCTTAVRAKGRFRCHLSVQKGAYRVQAKYMGSRSARPSRSRVKKFRVNRHTRIA